MSDSNQNNVIDFREIQAILDTEDNVVAKINAIADLIKVPTPLTPIEIV